MSGEPPGWSRATLDEIRPKDAPIIYGILQPGPDLDGGVKYVRPTEIVRDEIQVGQLRRTSEAIATKYRRAALQPNDVVFTIVGSIGKVALVPPELAGANITQSSSRIRPDPSVIEPLYLKFALKSPAIAKQCEAFELGTAVQRLNLEDVRKLEVSLAPVAEQRRIVAKLLQVLARVDLCQRRLARVPVLLKRFRLAVLAAACSGRLTTDWREQRRGSNEDVGAEVEQIRRRRQAQAGTGTETDRIHRVFSAVEENDSTELPDGWRYVCLNKLCSSLDYGTSAKSRSVGRVPVLRMGNIQNGEIDWTNLVYTSDPEEIERYSLTPNTVLFNRTNSPELVGKTAIYLGERPAVFAGYLIRLNPLAELDPEYLNYCLNTNYAKEFCARIKTDGVSQSNINAQRLGAFEVPFCSIAEQQEIVRRVKALLAAVAGKIEIRLAQAQAQVDKLTPSLLAKAFRGELVPTEAELARKEGRDYEPASVLLERVQQQREGETARAARSKAPIAATKVKRGTRPPRQAVRSR